jgi:3-phenylpropionate/trans-cinnamate dioxygenase ferredoxin reductase subunit
MNKTCIVVGASHAAAQFVTSLRQNGWEDRILVIGEEPVIPYHRPPLSKDYLAGNKTLEEITIRSREAYDEAGVEFLLERRVESLDPGEKTLTLSDGGTRGYDKLCLTVGSRVRTVDLPGVELDGIYYLRTLHDVERIREHVRPGAKAIIVGGGYIGLEVAAVLNKLDMDVTVLEMMERVMQRVTTPEVSEFYTRVHREEGVDIRCGAAVSGFEGGDRVQRVRCADGSTLEADLVVIGVGIVPNVELARDAGLKTDNGIVVDEYTRTGDPDIVAAGDCTFHYNPIYDRMVRLESVQNATDQAQAAAATVCGGEKPYHALPWFWSDQYDLKLQIAGLSQGYDEIVIRGDREGSRSFAVFYFREGRIIAVDAVNKPAEFMMGKKLITEGREVDRKVLADESIHMREFLKR